MIIEMQSIKFIHKYNEYNFNLIKKYIILFFQEYNLHNNTSLLLYIITLIIELFFKFIIKFVFENAEIQNV